MADASVSCVNFEARLEVSSHTYTHTPLPPWVIGVGQFLFIGVAVPEVFFKISQQYGSERFAPRLCCPLLYHHCSTVLLNCRGGRGRIKSIAIAKR